MVCSSERWLSLNLSLPMLWTPRLLVVVMPLLWKQTNSSVTWIELESLVALWGESEDIRVGRRALRGR